MDPCRPEKADKGRKLISGLNNFQHLFYVFADSRLGSLLATAREKIGYKPLDISLTLPACTIIGAEHPALFDLVFQQSASGGCSHAG